MPNTPYFVIVGTRSVLLTLKILFLTLRFIPFFLYPNTPHISLHHQESLIWFFITSIIFLLCIIHISAGIILPKYEPDHPSLSLSIQWLLIAYIMNVKLLILALKILHYLVYAYHSIINNLAIFPPAPYYSAKQNFKFLEFSVPFPFF